MIVERRCSGGNVAVCICNRDHRSEKQISTNLLCSSKQCRCQSDHSVLCRNNLFGFNPYQKREDKIFFKDVLDQLQTKLSHMQDYKSIFEKEVVSAYDLMIEQISVERDQLLDYINTNDRRLVLDRNQIQVLDMLLNQNQVLVQRQIRNATSYRKQDKNFNTIKQEVKKLEYKLKEDLKKIRKQSFNIFYGNQNNQIDKWKAKRAQIHDRLYLKSLQKLGIRALSLNNVSIKPIPEIFNWSQITHLQVNDINQECLDNLLYRSPKLKVLKIDSKLSFTQMSRISQFKNLQIVEASFDYHQDFQSDLCCRKNFDCDICSDRRRQEEREYERKQKRQYSNNIRRLFKRLITNSPHLKQISLNGSDLKSGSLINLNVLASLEKIDLCGNDFTFQDIHEFCQKAKGLQSLEVSILISNQDSLRERGQKKEKKKNSNRRYDDSQDEYENEEENKGQKLQGYSSEIRIQSICQLQKLTILEISETLLHNEQIQLLSKSLPHLISLNLDGNQNLGDEGIIIISMNMVNLQHLSVELCSITDQGLVAIAVGNPKLQSLYASKNFFTDDGITALCQNKVNLIKLNLNSNQYQLSTRTIKAIFMHLTKLQSLSIKNDILSPVSNGSLLYLSKIKTLKKLHIDNFSKVNIIQMLTIAQGLQDYGKITKISHYVAQLKSQLLFITKINQLLNVGYLKSKHSQNHFRNLQLKLGPIPKLLN